MKFNLIHACWAIISISIPVPSLPWTPFGTFRRNVEKYLLMPLSRLSSGASHQRTFVRRNELLSSRRSTGNDGRLQGQEEPRPSRSSGLCRVGLLRLQVGEGFSLCAPRAVPSCKHVIKQLPFKGYFSWRLRKSIVSKPFIKSWEVSPVCFLP